MVKRQQACRIVEIGINDLARAESLIQVAQRFAGDKKVWYTGIDLFDARPAGSEPLALKETYRILRATEATIRLVPGVPRMSLASAANAHQNTDLIVIGPDVTEKDLHGAWFYVPRMLHDRIRDSQRTPRARRPGVVQRYHPNADRRMGFARFIAPCRITPLSLHGHERIQNLADCGNHELAPRRRASIIPLPKCRP